MLWALAACGAAPQAPLQQLATTLPTAATVTSAYAAATTSVAAAAADPPSTARAPCKREKKVARL